MHLVTSIIKQRLTKIGLSIQQVSAMELSCVIGEYEIDVSCVNIAKQIETHPEQMEILLSDFVQKIYQHLLQNGLLAQIDIAVQERVEQCFLRVISIEHAELLTQQSFPWFQAIVPNHLGLSIVKEQDGIVRYLSPLHIIQHPKGLKGYQREAMLYMKRLLKCVEISVEQKIYILHIAEGFASSLLVILHQILQNMNIDQPFWCATPTRDILAYSTHDPQVLGQWSLDMYNSQAYPISPKTFIWRLQQSASIYTHWLRE